MAVLFRGLLLRLARQRPLLPSPVRCFTQTHSLLSQDRRPEEEIINEMNARAGNPDIEILSIRDAFRKLNEPDPEKAALEFLEGAKQALLTVSDLMSHEKFAELEQMVEHRLLAAVKKRFDELSQKEKDFVRVSESDLELVSFYPPFVTHNKPSEKLLFPVVYKGKNSQKLFWSANHFLVSLIFERSLAKDASQDFFVGFIMIFRLGKRKNVMIVP